ncbi:MAG: RnfABCDGE type electron transport complex subunit D [Oscillospiraceae bacterium]|nr:RnfABCDGE type electron transport complex subunit D [Oscillospiraceae bacterium]
METPSKPQKSKEFLETRSVSADYAVMLLAPCTVAVYRYGAKALFLIVLSIFICTLCRKIGGIVLRRSYQLRDYSAAVTGAMIALLLPASADPFMVLCAGIFAVVICVLPFGTSRNAPFSPAAAAICFLSVCWGDKMFSYPVLGAEDYFAAVREGTSITKMLIQNNSIGRNPAMLLEVLTGGVPSAIGAGCTLALLGALVYLVIRRPKNSVATLCFLLSASLMAIIFPRVSTGRLISLVMELCGGMILFSAIFFVSNPFIMPKRLLSRAVWGFAGGIICVLIRYVSSWEEAVCFGILIMAATASFFDKLPLTSREKKRIAASEPYVEIVKSETYEKEMAFAVRVERVDE